MSFHSEIENRLDEIVDTLRQPAGEFVPRVRSVLIAFLAAILRRLQALEDEEPTNPRIVVPAERKRQHTMELKLEDLHELTEAERRRMR